MRTSWHMVMMLNMGLFANGGTARFDAAHVSMIFVWLRKRNKHSYAVPHPPFVCFICSKDVACFLSAGVSPARIGRFVTGSPHHLVLLGPKQETRKHSPSRGPLISLIFTEGFTIGVRGVSFSKCLCLPHLDSESTAQENKCLTMLSIHIPIPNCSPAIISLFQSQHKIYWTRRAEIRGGWSHQGLCMESRRYLAGS